MQRLPDRPLDVQPMHFPVQRVAADAELARDVADVAMLEIELAEQRLALGSSERVERVRLGERGPALDRKSTRLNSSHLVISYAVFCLKKKNDNPNALRAYFRDIGRMVLAAEGRKANDSHAASYQYVSLPEYVTLNVPLHLHAVHFIRTLPTGSVDPNFGRRLSNRRHLNSLQNTSPYCYSILFFF